MISYHITKDGLTNEQLERFAMMLYREWLKFASGNSSHASTKKFVPHTLKYYYGITLVKVGNNHYRITAKDSEKSKSGKETDVADLIEKGHAAFNIGEAMLSEHGKDYMVVPLPAEYSSAKTWNVVRPQTTWDNRKIGLKTGVAVKSVAFGRTKARTWSPRQKGLSPTAGKTGRIGSSFVTMTKDNIQDHFWVPEMAAYAPGKNLARWGQNLRGKALKELLSEDIEL